MDKELPSIPPSPNGLDELNNLSKSITRAVARTKECVKDENLSAQAIDIFEDIRNLCSLNRYKVNELMLLTSRLWGAVADFNFVGREFLESEIEYIRAELRPFIDLTVN